MVVEIEVHGMDKVKAFLKGKNKEATKLVKLGLGRSAIFIQGEVKDSIAGNRAEKRSVDTGRFLNSVDVNVKTDSATVSSGLPYAKKLEEGTSKFQGRKHFKNSANRNKVKAAQIIQKELDKI